MGAVLPEASKARTRRRATCESRQGPVAPAMRSGPVWCSCADPQPVQGWVGGWVVGHPHASRRHGVGAADQVGPLEGGRVVVPSESRGRGGMKGRVDAESVSATGRSVA